MVSYGETEMTIKFYEVREERALSVISAYNLDGTAADTETLLASRFVCLQIIGDTACVEQWVYDNRLYLEHEKPLYGVRKVKFPIQGNEKIIEVIKRWQNGIFD